MSTDLPKIRNIAIIAHVDHGKTTLVDHILRQSGNFRQSEVSEERFLDSMDLEKERGITISAKNASFDYRDVKVNIVDTPGHSDFGGEVERVLDMVDGALLLVDASEGPLPQTRFVLKKAIEKNLKLIVCINKIDRKDARIQEVEEEIFTLFIDLGATDEQAEFETIYTIAKEGIATNDPENLRSDLKILLDAIVDRFPAPKISEGQPFHMLISNLDYSDYVGRLGVGRIRAGTIKEGQDVTLISEEGTKKFRITGLFTFRLTEKVKVESLSAGDIAILSGAPEMTIGDTISTVDNPVTIPRIKVDEPAVGITLLVNDSPFAGLDGSLVTSRNIKERLEKELLTNVSIRVEETDRTDSWKVMGRGELQLAILLENMRREGYEVLVGKPFVVNKVVDGETLEPMEKVTIDVESGFTGIVTQKLGNRKGVLNGMNPMGVNRTRLEFKIPARGLIGYRGEFLTDTRGTGIMSSESDGYEPLKGEIKHRQTGALISDRQGKATPYSIFHLEDRGEIFIQPGTAVYNGMIVGEHAKASNLRVNIVREKKLTNFRASGSDEAVRLTNVKNMNLEWAMEWIHDHELIEVTPKNIRLRCRELN